jgi:imidazolonepropionase-like amidohydrolase
MSTTGLVVPRGHAALVAALAVLGAVMLGAPAAAQGTVVGGDVGSVTITHARLFDGSRFVEDATLVVKDGKVATVTKGGAAPAGNVVDAAGRFVTPGLVDANSAVGIGSRDLNEQSDEVTPQMRILDSLNPRDPSIRRARNQGVTAACLTPGNANVIGGMCAVVKLAGRTPQEMLVREDVGLRLALGAEPAQGNRPIRGGLPDSIFYRRPTTRMGVIWEIRKAFYDAMKYRDQKSLLPGQNGGAPTVDEGKEILLRALDGKLISRFTARAEQDIRTALRMIEEFPNLRIMIDDPLEAYKVLDVIAAAKVPVVAGPPSSLVGRDGAEARWNTITLLAERGIPVAIHSGGSAMSLVQEAAFASRCGMSREAALAAVTSVAADVVGVADRLGALDAGKDGDFVIWSGDPLDFTTSAQAVYIQGIDRTR